MNGIVGRLQKAIDPKRADRPAAGEPRPARPAETDEVRAMVAADRSVRALGERADTPPGYRLVGFDLLAGCPVTTDAHAHAHDLPPDVLALRGRDVTMFGMVVPLRAVEGMRELLLVRSLWAAAFTDAPAMNEVVRVRLRGGSTADYEDLALRPVRVRGRFLIEPTAEHGVCTGMFELRSADVEVVR